MTRNRGVDELLHCVYLEVSHNCQQSVVQSTEHEMSSLMRLVSRVKKERATASAADFTPAPRKRGRSRRVT